MTSISRTADEVEVAAQALLGLSMRALAAVDGRVSAPQLRALLVIAEQGPMPLTVLAASLQVGVSSASRLVDRLVDADLVDRQPAPGNRRQVRLELTADGTQVLSDLSDRRRRDIEVVLRRMEPAARAELLRGMRSFAAHALPHASSLPA